MNSPSSHAIERNNNRFYSYPVFGSTKSEINETTFSINSLESLQSYADIKKCQETKDSRLNNVKARINEPGPSSFYPLQKTVENKPENHTLPSKFSRFTKFLHKFQSKISKSTNLKTRKYNTITGINVASANNDPSASSWKRCFSRHHHHTSMFYTTNEKQIHLRDPVDKATEAKLIDIFSPPVDEPMKTIDSFKDQAYVKNQEISTTNHEPQNFGFDIFYNDSFFTTAVRRPVSYDNSQITDETIVI
ncbi:hypothetical protein FOB58_003606 [Candida parapsilosis]|uniref:Uncharacterized protein n=2 Tax=Candida parapsilosis TaxID=5480 RepID=G8BIH1_CANPC|nr:uncharacterized protein CPAR2_402370 [Candida parapsilosis]KAF6047133.1 hypothetical protein FOB60_004669 [Candida parapsilosis]KAF6047528.1 hypothetical protein FOB58_003606 [Candida parapsilosis]KAF6050499.1 hypothetical protein FOB59_002745 [Candida parapsilosis]KAF6061620.1 hypothetical protein FOB61_004377 [Candida parapsilosis]KAI5901695.1 hypothetical protein K4G60_g833 [Candida parapsilosis]